MRSATVTSLASLFASLAVAQTELEIELYPEFAKDMLHWGYKWEAFTLTTDDSYKLTTFRITERVGHEVVPDPDLNPVVLMHGLGCDATSWVDPS